MRSSFVGGLLVLCACSRSELSVGAAIPEAGVGVFDAAARRGSLRDAGSPRDAALPRDASLLRDAGSRIQDAGRGRFADAAIARDAATVDAGVPPACVRPNATSIDLISDQGALYRFDPALRALQRIGDVNCASTGGSPFSMAIDRSGTAYVVYTDGELFRVNTTDASCSTTSFVPGQFGLQTFGMAFVGLGSNDELFVSGTDGKVPETNTLARIDTRSLELSVIGNFPTSSARCELTGTDMGRLFAFCFLADAGSMLTELDPTSAKTIATDTLMVGDARDAFAVSTWNGLFFIFTGTGSQTEVTQFDPATLTETHVATLDILVVGAGSSTCPPTTR